MISNQRSTGIEEQLLKKVKNFVVVIKISQREGIIVDDICVYSVYSDC